MNKTIPDIRFFDFNFKLLHTENEFLSSNWTIYYNDIGTFEAHFDLKSDTVPVVMDNDLRKQENNSWRCVKERIYKIMRTLSP